MTLDGTNTWVLHTPGGDEAVVVDPGPLDEGHLQAVLEVVRAAGARVALTLLTHGHFDHAESADRWAELTGSPVRGAGHGRAFTDDEWITVGDLRIQVLLTPGHTKDSVSFLVPDQQLLLTGDTVLGRGTSVVAHPDGELAAYLASLDRLAGVAGGMTLGPGHGPTHADAAAVIAQYARHRLQRLDQVRAALAAGAGDADDVAQAVVEQVYADVPREVWPAAHKTVQAQLDYLAARG
ncbi:MBL fold metallo-hydrolase [Allobranchiibius huperziae]|uniref:Glyoxylase-like metal-dependent hydrolase (Beta-lactamase superfamily II) n=1 Tax=Allobranchiibius huperziae TaxID=1874116 RepID=A0A853D9Y4_9MICO|nr:MBL fold metallo-hydrolase [Allobranchiibius huperziae]NYJ73397.1 glyoxylase-like metal-dependent hydrolase (beta-lactamase superfamily II) [Allobranchiibius huperziae]